MQCWDTIPVAVAVQLLLHLLLGSEVWPASAAAAWSVSSNRRRDASSSSAASEARVFYSRKAPNSGPWPVEAGSVSGAMSRSRNQVLILELSPLEMILIDNFVSGKEIEVDPAWAPTHNYLLSPLPLDVYMYSKITWMHQGIRPISRFLWHKSVQLPRLLLGCRLPHSRDLG